MGLSMKKVNGGRNRKPYILAIIVAVIIAFAIVMFLPFDFEMKKLLFFILINILAIASVFVLNLARRK